MSGAFAELAIASTYGLHALGIILAYRSARVINLSQVQMGVPGAIIAAQTTRAWGAPIWLSVTLGLALGAFSGALIEVFVFRRLRDRTESSRLIASLAVALLAEGGSRAIAVGWQVTNPNTFQLQSLLGRVLTSSGTLVLVSACVWWLVNRSIRGLKIRAAYDSHLAAKARGINAPLISTWTFAAAGALSALAATLALSASGATQFGVVVPISQGVILRVLAIAALARFWSVSRLLLSTALLAGVEHLLLPQVSSSASAREAFLSVVSILAVSLGNRVRIESEDKSGATLPPSMPTALTPVALVLVALVPLLGGNSTLLLWNSLLVEALVGVSLVVLLGWGGFLSIGQFGIAALGALLAGYLIIDRGFDLFLALVAAAVAGAIAATVATSAAIRDRRAFASSSLGLSVVAAAALLAGKDEALGAYRPTLFGRFEMTDRIVALLGLALVAACLRGLSNVRRSRFGRAIIASRENSEMAASVGIDLVVLRMKVATLSGAIAGLAGATWFLTLGAPEPGAFAMSQSLEATAMVVIGGSGRLSGALLGVSYLVGARSLLPAEWAVLFGGAGLLTVVILRPDGLIGLIDEMRGWLSKKLDRNA